MCHICTVLPSSRVRRYHRHYGSSGHVWQGRFKAFSIQEDEHFLTVLRYVERNALRGRLVKRAEDWSWGSLRSRLGRGGSDLLAEPPVALPRNWKAAINEPQTEAEVAAIRHSIQRGDAVWQRAVDEACGAAIGARIDLASPRPTAEGGRRLKSRMSPFLRSDL